MTAARSAELDGLAAEALAIGDIRSAVIVVPTGGASPSLRVVAAAGIAGPALDGLAAAIQDPRHPVARALTDDGPTFDVPPMNPGGPRLRSHLPARLDGSAPGAALGVLALAHDQPMAAEDRDRLIALAERAAAALDRTQAER